ncbi:MAG: DUF3754 domain-containing protein [Planctomycetaceae bacterium]|nr:DUF3754 domain-containing protein [Planctomycetaceae bacterium]
MSLKKVNTEGDVMTIDSPAVLEHFIPIRAAQLVRLLSRQRGLSAQHIQQFQMLADLLTAHFHRSTIFQLEDYLEDYAAFDPDQELVYHHREGAGVLAMRGERFAQQVAELLKTANYLRLTQEEIEESLRTATGWGVRYSVDFKNFDLLQVYVRGIKPRRLFRRMWWTPWRKESRWIDVYKRVVLIFRMKSTHKLGPQFDADSIYLKIFKDMPETEVDMMMPGSRVQFSWADRGKVLFPAIGGIFAGMRLAKTLVIWGPRITLFIRFVALTSILKWIGGSTWFADWALNAKGDGLNFTGWTVAGVLALTFYFVKYWLSHNRTTREHQGLLTNNLYLRNLGNNGAVLFQIMEDAKEQELRELFLSYFLLWQYAGPNGWSSEELDCQAQGCLRKLLKREIDFEVADALRKLRDFKLVEQAPNGHWVAVDVETAIERVTSRKT